MNKVTLTFKDPEFEKKFKLSQHQIELNILRVNFKYICVLALIPIINNTIQSNLIYAAILSVIFLGILIARFLGHRSVLLFDYVCFVNLILLNCSVPISLYFQSATNQHLQMYFLGQSSCYCLFSFLLGTQFLLKAVVCSSNCLLQLALLWLKDENFASIPRYFFLIYTITIVNNLYLQEKDKRLRFQLQCTQNQFGELIFRSTHVAVIQCNYKPQMDAIHFLRSNLLALKRFKIQDSPTLRNFLRNMQLSSQIKNKKKYIPLTKIKNHLEHFIYQKFRRNFSTKQNKSIYELSFKLKCKYDFKNYLLNISFFYQNEPQCMLIVESNFEKKSSDLKQKIESLKLIVQNLILRQEKLIANCFFSINNALQTQNLTDNKRITFNLHILKMWIQIMANNFQNAKFFVLGVQETGIESIQIKYLIQELVRVYRPYMAVKNIKCRILIEKNYELYNAKSLLKQLINNIFSNCVFNCTVNSDILIEILEKKIIDTDCNIIQIRFYDSNESITASQINGLPIFNAYSTESYSKMAQLKKVAIIWSKNKLDQIWIDCSILNSKKDRHIGSFRNLPKSCSKSRNDGDSLRSKMFLIIKTCQRYHSTICYQIKPPNNRLRLVIRKSFIIQRQMNYFQILFSY